MNTAPETIKTPRTSSLAAERTLVTDRRLLWGGVFMTALIVVIRLNTQLILQIKENPQVQELVSSLDDEALVDFAVWVGASLAAVISMIFQTVYLFTCAMVDEKLLQGVMISLRRTNRRGQRSGLGPAAFIGAAATVPVQLAALLCGITAPKESPFAYIWLAILVAITAAWVWTRSAIRQGGARARLLAAIILAIAAAVSLLL